MEHKLLARYPLGNPRRLWKQDNFVLSNFAAYGTNMRNAIRNCREAGFNLLEMGWATPEQAEEAVVLCEQYGIDLVYQNLKRYGGMSANRFYGEKNDLEGTIRDHRQWKHLIGYYIWDEPNTADQMEETRMLMDLCEREAPDKLAFTVAIPSYDKNNTWRGGSHAKYLETFVQTIDPVVLSLDYYPVGYANDYPNDEVQLDRSNMWHDLSRMKMLGKQYDMPIWFYYQGQDLHKSGILTFPKIRMMMYAAAMYGAKGLQHYEARGAVITADGDKDIFFAEQKAIHEEFRNLGETLMALECKRVIHDDAVVPRAYEFCKPWFDRIEDSAYLREKLPHRVSVGELEDAYGNGYMMILNRDFCAEKSVTLPLNGQYRVYEVSKQDGLQHILAESTDKLELSFAAGDAVLLRLQKAEEEAFTVEYRLSK